MRKTLRILATISLLTVGFLGASCNKNEADEPATRPQPGGVQEVTTGTGVPNSSSGRYQLDTNSRILYERSGDNNWRAIASLPSYTGGKVYVNQGALSNNVGNDGDYYVRTGQNNKVYQKINGAWTIPVDEIYIADTNFKNALLQGTEGMGSVDSNNDGKISREEAKAVGAIRVSDKNIRSLSGIEFFENLQVLEASNNHLTSVSLNNLTKLTNIVLLGNQLSGILDFSALLNLKTGSETQILRNGNNPNIERIKVATPAKAAALNIVENTLKYSSTDATDRNIELDPILKAAIIESSGRSIDRNNDGEISMGEAEAYSGGITASAEGITSFSGLEYFKNVISIYILPSSGQNTLADGKKKISLTGLSALTTLTISTSTLEEVELKNLPVLKTVRLVNNSINKVSFDNTPLVEDLSLERNNLTAIDNNIFSVLTKLTKLNLLGNRITGSINLTPLTTDLSSVAGNFQIMRTCRECTKSNNPDEIIVKTAAEASALNTADSTGKYRAQNNGSGDSTTALTIPNRRLKTLLIQKLQRIYRATYFRYTDSNELFQADLDKIVDEFTVDNGVTNLEGVQYLRKVKKLILFNEGGTTIDVSNLALLEEIQLGGVIATITGSNPTLKTIVIPSNRNITKLNLLGFSNITTISTVEDSNNRLPITCIAVPASRVDAVKSSLRDWHKNKVQTTTCN